MYNLSNYILLFCAEALNMKELFVALDVNLIFEDISSLAWITV